MNPDQAPVKKSFGPMIGIIVIVILLVVGAFYIWGGKAAKVEAPTAPEAVQESSTTGDLRSLETDLSSTDVDIDLSALDSLK